ncbi:response regulator [Parasphingopyxis marina]|uniref:Response regulator n=1 Tax=Parasphingopyxis marina TaxID=2761622 RepID=A0A842I161_9SPHN|nr:response regulator [Parasphingopyxis marina]MBC2777504.1 response regulator [Parasphingopyxis marina]
MAHIIYAEDDDLIVDIVRDVLQKDGHVVGVVTDGESALKAIRLKRPDLVILDCNMPEMTGIEVLSRMRVDPALCDIPVLMLTGRRGAQDVDIAMYSGANEYLKKPFDPDYLAFVVDNLLSKYVPSGSGAHHGLAAHGPGRR